MEYIVHRVNTIEELCQVPCTYGVELDLRDRTDGRVYIQHHPFKDGEDFEEYLKRYHHKTMILNIKSERIEHKVLELLEKYGIRQFFFLDSSFPMVKLLSDLGEYRTSVRFSEYEGMDTAKAMAGKARWVWVDTFTRIPLDKEGLSYLKGLGYHTCLVSPELQGQPEKTEAYARQVQKECLEFDAVCTKLKYIELWESIVQF